MNPRWPTASKGAMRARALFAGTVLAALLAGVATVAAVEVGSRAPELDARTLDGERLRMRDLRGKVVIVDFWATWCEPCKKSFPAYQKLSDKFAGKLRIVGISVDEEPDGIAAFAAETGVSFPLAWDSDQSVAAAYSPPTMPTSYVIDKNGIVRHVHDGYRPGDEATLEKHVAELVKE